MSKQNDKGMSAVSPVEGGRRPTGTGETKAARKRFWAQRAEKERLEDGENRWCGGGIWKDVRRAQTL